MEAYNAAHAQFILQPLHTSTLTTLRTLSLQMLLYLQMHFKVLVRNFHVLNTSSAKIS